MRRYRVAIRPEGRCAVFLRVALGRALKLHGSIQSRDSGGRDIETASNPEHPIPHARSGKGYDNTDALIHPFFEQPPPVQERRRYPRTPITVALSLEIDGQIIRAAECRSVSLGGMFIFTDHSIPIDHSGFVTLTKRCGEVRHSFSAPFTVVRREDNSPLGRGIGVLFNEMAENDRTALHHIIDYQRSVLIREKLVISGDKMEGIHCGIAQTREDLESAYRLVHDSYVHEGYMDRHPSGLRLCIQNALPQATTFLVKRNAVPIATATLFPDSLLGLPMDTLYSKELSSLRDAGRFIGEVGLLAVSLDVREPNPTLPLYIHKAIYRYALEYLNIDDTVLAINPKHQLYYRHVMLCEQIGEERTYETVKGNPAIALQNDLRTLKSRLHQVYHNMPAEKDLHAFYCREHRETILLPPSGHPVSVWNSKMISYFFEERTDIFAKANPRSVSLLKSLYPA